MKQYTHKNKMKNSKNILKFLFLFSIFYFLFFDFIGADAQTITFNGIDMLWETNTYIPYYYKGKAIITPLSEIKIAAMPHIFYAGRRLSNSELIFEWYLNNSRMEEYSGKGRDYLIFKSSILSNEKSHAKVWVSNISGTFKKEGVIVIPNSKKRPEILVYQYDPSQKELSQKAISSVQIASGDTAEFIAEPYFIPMEGSENIIYQWMINGKRLRDENPPNILTISSHPGSRISAFADINVKFNNLLESVKKSFFINVM